jgi:zinc resistance-associated protein
MEVAMWKAVLAGTTAAVIAGSSLVLAQQMPGRDGGPRWHPSPADRSAFTDARIAALKAGLKLTPEQEKNWPAFEAAIRDMSKAHADRMAARGKEQPSADPVERLRRGADALGTAATGLKKLADAEEPLYKSLDDAQRHRFQILAQALRPHHHKRFADWQGRGWFGHDGRGQDRGSGDWCDRSEQGGPNTNL